MNIFLSLLLSYYFLLSELRYANILGRIIALTGRVNQAVQNAIRGETNIIRTQTKVCKDDTQKLFSLKILFFFFERNT